MKRKKLKASVTIEAALIIPIVMIIIVAMIFASFMAHDSVTMDAKNTYEVIENANQYNDNIENMQPNMQDAMTRGLIVTKNINVESKKRVDGIIVKSCGNFTLPFSALQELFGMQQINESSEIAFTNLDGRESLLKSKAVIDGIKKIGEDNS